MQLNDVPRHGAGVISRIVDGEVVLVQPVEGTVRVLNAVGSRLWELADGERSIAELAGAVATEYGMLPGRVQADALLFYADLAQRGLLAVGDGQP